MSLDEYIDSFGGDVNFDDMPIDIDTNHNPLDQISDEEAHQIASQKIEAEDKAKAKNKLPQLADITDEEGQTDIANAERFIDRYQAELLYVPPWTKWLSWDGMRWAEDCGIGARQRAKRYSKSLWRQIEPAANSLSKDSLSRLISFIKSTNQSAKINAYLQQAECDERVVCPVEKLNGNPLFLNCRNGTVDLLTGDLRQHDPADRITQVCNVAFNSNAECPKWLETLELIFDSDGAMVRYVQQILGISLSGEAGENLLPIAYGNGCNGKSTVWNCVAGILGDYALLANDELLLGTKSNHPTEIASLYQKRFVAVSEPERNSKMRESRVKGLTGEAKVSARRMNEDFWTFDRTFTFWLSSNHLPRIDGADDGIWRRIKLIPFSIDLRTKVTPIPDFDKWMIEHEGSGILAWMVRGYQDYKANGLVEPETVKNATKTYRDNSDELGEFLDDHCDINPHGRVAGGQLYELYCECAGKSRMSKNAFGQAMSERFERVKSGGKNYYVGIRLRERGASDETPQNQSENQEKGDPEIPRQEVQDFPTRIQNLLPEYPHVSLVDDEVTF